jgi:hypothetical protein
MEVLKLGRNFRRELSQDAAVVISDAERIFRGQLDTYSPYRAPSA